MRHVSDSTKAKISSSMKQHHSKKNSVLAEEKKVADVLSCFDFGCSGASVVRSNTGIAVEVIEAQPRIETHDNAPTGENNGVHR